MSFLACAYCQRQFSYLSEPFYRTPSSFVCHSDLSRNPEAILYEFGSDSLLTYYANLESSIQAMVSNGYSCESLQSLHQAVINALQMRLEEGLKELVGQVPEEPWTCANCGFSNFPTNPICYNCRASPKGEYPPIQTEAVPDLSTLSQITTVCESTGFWTCKKCQAVNPMQVPRCSGCVYVNLAVLSTGGLADPEPPPVAVSAPMPSQCWTCLCSYEHNLLSSVDCLLCKSPRPGTRCDVCGARKAVEVECQGCKAAVPAPEEMKVEEQKDESGETAVKEEEQKEVPAPVPAPPLQEHKVKAVASPRAAKAEPAAGWKCYCGRKAATVLKCNVCGQKKPVHRCIEDCGTVVEALGEICKQCAEKKETG